MVNTGKYSGHRMQHLASFRDIATNITVAKSIKTSRNIACNYELWSATAT